MPPEPDPPAPPVGRWGAVWRVLLVVAGGLVSWLTFAGTVLEVGPTTARWWFFLGDPLVGVVAGLLTRWRRRWPLRVAGAVTLLSTLSASAGGAWLLVLLSVATRRRWRELAWLAPLSVITGYAIERLYPGTNEQTPWQVTLILLLALVAVAIAVGYAVGGRRELLQERIVAAERDQERRVAQAAAAERTRIAREMHDVLAHRISLVAMHAGVLTYRQDLTPEQQHDVALTIETNAQQALTDLREVLGVLRVPRDGATAPEPPQPGFGDIPALVREVSAAGMRVDLLDETDGEVPTPVGRTAYRVVQEALTNTRKHAAGARVHVDLSGSEPTGLSVTVTNPRALAPVPSTLPESGLGLLGLAERISLAGGSLRHGPSPGGGYAVCAWLPWAAARSTRSPS